MLDGDRLDGGVGEGDRAFDGVELDVFEFEKLVPRGVFGEELSRGVGGVDGEVLGVEGFFAEVYKAGVVAHVGMGQEDPGELGLGGESL